jgi:hypothetical protein
MNSRRFAAVVALVFAIVLAVMLGMRLSGQVAAIAFGAAAGVIAGVPSGLLTAYLAHRWGLFPPQQASVAPPVQIDWQGFEPGAVMLSAEQAELLAALLQRIDTLNALPASSEAAPAASQQPAASVLSRPPARQRDISVVGGADLTQSLDDQ